MIKIHCLYVQNFYWINKNLFNYIDSRKEKGRGGVRNSRKKKKEWLKLPQILRKM